MKKEGILIILVLLFSIIAIQLFYVSALDQSIPGAEEVPFGKEITTGQEKYEQFTTAQNKSDFLKQQVGEILLKHKYLGPILETMNKTAPITNPLFEYTIGMRPSLTWLFVLTFVISASIGIWIYRTNKLVSPFSNYVQIIFSLGLTIGFGIIGVFKNFAQGIINTISLFNKWWMQLIGIGVVIIGFTITSIFSKQIEEWVKKRLEKQEKEKEKRKIEELEAKQKIHDELQKAVNEAFND